MSAQQAEALAFEPATLALIARSILLAISMVAFMVYAQDWRRVRSYEAEVKRRASSASMAPYPPTSTITEGDISDDWALIGSAGEDLGSAVSKKATVVAPGPAVIKPLSKPPPKVPGSSTGSAPVAATAVNAAAADRPSSSDSLPPKYTLEILEAAGVPTADERACVLELAQRLGCVPGQVEPLCDPLTLLRFCRSRDLVLDDALHMYRETMAWRAQFGLGEAGVPAGVPGVMGAFGQGAQYAAPAATATGGVGYGCLVPGQLLAAGAAAESRAAAGLPLQGSFVVNASTKAPGDDNGIGSSSSSSSSSADSIPAAGISPGSPASVLKAPPAGPGTTAAAVIAAEPWAEAEAFKALTTASKRVAALEVLPVVSTFGDERSPGSSPQGPATVDGRDQAGLLFSLGFNTSLYPTSSEVVAAQAEVLLLLPTARAAALVLELSLRTAASDGSSSSGANNSSSSGWVAAMGAGAGAAVRMELEGSVAAAKTVFGARAAKLLPAGTAAEIVQAASKGSEALGLLIGRLPVSAAALIASELCRRQPCCHELHCSSNGGRIKSSKGEIPALVALAAARPAGAAAILAQCGLSSTSNSSNSSRSRSSSSRSRSSNDDAIALRYAVLRAMGAANKEAVMARMPENDQAVLARYAAAHAETNDEATAAGGAGAVAQGHGLPATGNSSNNSSLSGGESADNASTAANGGVFGWTRKPLHELPEREGIGQGCAFAHRLQFKTEHGEPIAVWRLGLVDLAGIAREGWEREVTAAFVSHLEEMLQHGRAASLAQGRMVRARLVVDGTGLGLGLLRYLKVVKGITSLGKAYFPETTASASIVNAPWVFAKLYAVVSPLLTPLMRQKVCVMDGNFGGESGGLTAHSGLKLEVLPRFLGGNTDDSQVPAPTPAPPRKS